MVTALHYGVALEKSIYTHKKHIYNYSDQNKNLNLIAIRNFINSLDIPVKIISSENIDNDFCFMCMAPRILTTGGGFSKLVKNINLLFKNAKEKST